MFPLPGGHRAVVKKEFPGRQQRDLLPGKGGQIAGQPAGLFFLGAHHHHRTVQPAVQAGGKVGPVDRSQAGDGRGRGAGIQSGEQLLKFGNLV